MSSNSFYVLIPESELTQSMLNQSVNSDPTSVRFLPIPSQGILFSSNVIHALLEIASENKPVLRDDLAKYRWYNRSEILSLLGEIEGNG